MNKFDENYIFRRAQISDCDKIMEFIRDEWNVSHILARNDSFFCYEFQDGININFIMAIDRKSDSIEGILGYLPASKDTIKLDIWPVMWKVKEVGNMPFLGIEIYRRMRQITDCRCTIGVGGNYKTSIPILKLMLGFHIDKMKQFYCLKKDSSGFKIASIKQYRKQEKSFFDFSCHLRSFLYFDDLMIFFQNCKNEDIIPYKDEWYLKKRYFDHPIYQYKVWGVEKDGGNDYNAVLVGREIEWNDSKILRIVDFIGNETLLGGLYDEFRQLLEVNKYEYIDFFCYGISDKHLERGGFVLRDETDDNVIPNYFEPFVPVNVDIWINCSHEKVRFCKADGDQDRPNFY